MSTVEEREEIVKGLAQKLVEAAEKGDLKTLQEELSDDLVDCSDFSGETALTRAANRGQLEAIKLLVQRKASVDRNNDYARTALFEACRQGHVEIAAFLLDQKANLDKSNAGDWTPLMAAAEKPQETCVRLLLDRKADTSRKSSVGETALDLAAKNGWLTIVKLIFQHEASLDKPTRNADAALYSACQNNRVEIAAFLLDNKANVNKLHERKWTALMAAASKGHQACVRLLFARNADISLKNERGKTALDIVKAQNQQEILALFAALEQVSSLRLVKQTHTSSVDKTFGNNELHALALLERKEEEALQLLLHTDVSASLPNKQGKSPAAIARELRQDKLAALLATAESFQALPTVQFSELEMQKKLSEGAFGEAWLAQWHRSAVVVKTLKRKLASWTAENFIEFANEASASERVSKHPNIVPFVGVCKRMPTFAMVYQFMTRGSLEDLLVKSNKPQSLQTIVTFAIEAATGLAHLHANQPEPLLHCDFALRNLLLDGAGVVRVSDFGLAMKAPKTDEVKDTQKPVAWSAPEALSGQFSTRSDVFSFGVVMWEMIARKSPHHFWLSGLSKVLGKQATVNDIADAVQSGLRLPLPNGTPAALVELVNECWLAEPSARPEIGVIVDRLKAFRDSFGAESKPDPKEQSLELQVALARNALLENERAQLLQSLERVLSSESAAAANAQARAIVSAAVADARIRSQPEEKSFRGESLSLGNALSSMQSKLASLSAESAAALRVQLLDIVRAIDAITPAKPSARPSSSA